MSMQKAEKKISLFRELLERSQNDDEKLFLNAVISGDNDGAERIYRRRLRKNFVPLYPFMELCSLPVLFRPGDVIREGGRFYYVHLTPCITEGHSSFLEECYLCYELSGNCRNYSYLLG